MSKGWRPISEMETYETKITADNLPQGLKWEEDGSCWRAVTDRHCGAKGWRWRPENFRAFGKGEPEGEMTDFVPPTFDRIRQLTG